MWDYTILEWFFEPGFKEEPKGVLLQIDNGDTQYLTMKEYKVFLKNREKLENENRDIN
tara:strand:- start:40645 stop:40818 length:174 start_codon:yes stop_codon:yes gene_type:complete